tara:strand:- start:5356 stop:6759 length:1404 start_codon:yes stop_codon:yes gene_type:complete
MSKISQMILPTEVETSNYQANSPSLEARTDTIYLRPQNVNNNVCSFRLQNNGILDLSKSGVVLQALGNENNGYIVNNGVGGLVESCSLRFGNVVVANTNNFSGYMACSRSFVSGDTKRYLDSYTYLTSDIFENRIDAGNTAHDGIGFATSINPAHTRLTTNADNGSDGFLPLSLLFPGFMSLDIATFVLHPSQEITIDIVFTNESGYGDRVIRTTSGQAFSSNTIAENNVLLIQEVVYFSSLRMAQIQNSYKENGFTSSYTDIISTKNDLGDFAQTDSAKRETFDIGGAGKMVEGFLAMTPRTDRDDSNTHATLVRNAVGRYGSSSFQNNSFNLIINGERVLPLDAENMYFSIRASLLGSFIENDYPQIPKGFYDTFQNEGVSDVSYNGINNSAGMKGELSYFGMKLKDCKVNNVPVRLDLYRKQKILDPSDPTDSGEKFRCGLTTFLFVKRIFRIDEMGMVSSTYA